MSYGDKTREILALLETMKDKQLPCKAVAYITDDTVPNTRSALMRLARLKKIGKEKHEGINYYRSLK